MSQGSATAQDCPGRFDCVIDGFGYMLLESLEPNVPFRSHRAIYSYTPPYVDRSNISGNFGDTTEAFWLTASQNDWSLGQYQKFFRLADATSLRRYWQSYGANVNIPGQITIKPDKVTLNQFLAPTAGCPVPAATGLNTQIIGTGSVGGSLYSVTTSGSITNSGGWGASGTLNQWGMCSDSRYLYIAHSQGISKWDGTNFTSFSGSTNAGSIATLNNELFSSDGSTLNVYSTTGAKTTLFTWQDNVGAALPTQHAKILPFGGNLLVFFPQLQSRPQLWQYDGTGTSQIADLPESCVGYDMEIIDGVVFLSGQIMDDVDSFVPGAVPIIFYYNNGEIGELWRSLSPGIAGGPVANSAYMPALGDFEGRLFFTDPTGGVINQYDIGSGAITSVVRLGSYMSVSSVTPSFFSSSPVDILFGLTGGTVAPILYPSTTTFQSTGVVSSSLIDFESTLTKNFHGVRVDWEGGGSQTVDIGYQIDSLGGGYTTLQAAATSGVEYPFPAGVNGIAASIQLTLNNVGGATPRVKRLFLRSSPFQPAFRTVTYILDLSGIENKDDPVTLADDTTHPLAGHQQAVNLNKTILKTTPVVVTDRFGTYTAVPVLESEQTEIYDWREGWDNPTQPGGFVAKITMRQV